MKQELQDSEIGTINKMEVVCRTLNPNTKVSACRKCFFDHLPMPEGCDYVKCTDLERQDKRDVYFELVK